MSGLAIIIGAGLYAAACILVAALVLSAPRDDNPKETSDDQDDTARS